MLLDVFFLGPDVPHVAEAAAFMAASSRFSRSSSRWPRRWTTKALVRRLTSSAPTASIDDDPMPSSTL